MKVDSPIGYIYITENMVNGKRYIGQHHAIKLDLSYLGSGISLCKAIKKYGRENFKPTILEWCYSDEELNKREKYWIGYYEATTSKRFYNISEGGEGVCLVGLNHPNYGKKNSPDTIRKKSEALMGHKVSESTKQKLRVANLGKQHSEETKNKLRDLSTGRKHTKEDIKKMKLHSLKGKDNPACRPEVRAYMGKSKRKRIMCIETGRVFESTREAANYLGVSCDANIGSSAREYQKGHIVKGNGYHWKYL